jgi:hypothetical protein
MRSLLFVIIIILAANRPASASPSASLAKADSLFRLRQFTQSFDLYHSLWHQKKYTPAMLLKMAYIQEGLGHLSQSLFFLTLYYNVSHDAATLTKIQEVATRHSLQGYTPTETARVAAFLQEHSTRITAALLAFIALLTAAELYAKRKNRRVVPWAIAQFVAIALLIAHQQLATPPAEGIVAAPSTYLMRGPSAAAPVIGIIGEGHQLEITGHRDVWVKVKWMEREAFVKRNALLEEAI